MKKPTHSKSISRIYYAILFCLILFPITNAWAQNRLYWVGKNTATPNWNVAANWSTTDNGTPGDGGTPTTGITVVFNNNSFTANGQSVNVTATASCDSMIWEASSWQPIFNMGTFQFNVAGSMKLQPNMIVQSGVTTNALVFTSGIIRHPGESVSTANHNIPRPVMFAGAGKTWFLQDSLKVMLVNGALITRYDITHTAGTVTTNGQYVLCKDYLGTQTGVKSLNIAGSTIDVSTWTYNHTDATAMTIAQTANSVIKVAANFTGKPTDRYNVVEAGTGTLQAGTFTKIIMNKEGGLLNSTGANTVLTDSLVLDYMGNTTAAATLYRIQGGSAFTINSYFGNTRATGICSNKIELRSSSSTPVNITMGAVSNVDLSNVDFFNINITGPNTPYFVPNSYSISNSINSGWSSRLYWIGRTGNWNLVSNWSTESGGSANACNVPGTHTTVVFDDNSFNSNAQVVTLNVAGVCDSMIWSGATYTPTFTMNSTLDIYGSLEFKPNMVIGGNTNALNFTSLRTGQSITTANHNIPRPVNFNSTTGEWFLMDSLKLLVGTAAQTLTFTNGSLNLNGQYVRCNTIEAGANNARRLNIVNSTIDVNSWNYTAVNSAALTLAETANSLIRVNNTTAAFGTVTFVGRPTDYYYNVVAGAGTLHGGIFNKITMDKNNSTLNSATLTNNITTDTLILAPGNNLTYRIASGSTLTIGKFLQNIVIDPTDCNERVFLAATGITQANIVMKPASVVDLSNIGLTNLKITGDNAPYYVLDGTDFGGNEGWDISGTGTLYWVGGTGNWNNPARWSLESGIPNNPCNLLPTAQYSVVFDENSELFSSSFVNLTAAGACKDMIWIGPNGPTFATASQSLTISGSMELQPGMVITNTGGTLTFNSAYSGNTIKTNNVQVPWDITFNNGTGEWTLQDPLIMVSPAGTAFYTLNLASGSFNLSGNYIRCGAFSVSGRINIANSTIDATSWWCNPAIAPVTTNSLIRVTASFTGRAADQYNVVEAGNTTLSAGTFSKIIMDRNNGTLSSGVTTDTLLFGWDKTFNVQAGQTINIRSYLGNLTSLGSCPKKVNIRSTTAAIATFNMSAGMVSGIGNVNFSNIRATGPEGPYLAQNSIDLGGSSGWTMTPPEPFDNNRIYWVGGAGNWSDLSHWAAVSGGAPTYCMLPESEFTVVFDQNSGLNDGDIVFMDMPAFCDSIVWENSSRPIFDMGTSDLTLSGSLILQPNMTVRSSRGSILFRSDRAQEGIKTGNVNVPKNLFFSNINCEWILHDSLCLTNGSLIYDLTFFDGSLNLNGKYLMCANFTSSIENPTLRQLNIANATIDVSNWIYTTGNMPLTVTETGNSLIRVANNFTGRPGDYYNVVEAGIGTLQGGTFSKVFMNKNNGIINSAIAANNVITDTLLLDMNNTYRMFAGRTVTVNKFFGNVKTYGGCTEKIILRSHDAVAANISMGTPSTVDVDNIDLYYIAITGPGVPYTIEHSIDLGGNSGWVQSDLPYTGPLYWIGGTGNWNNLSRWSTSSGGPPNVCVLPTSENTVIFDGNSGLGNSSVVTLNVPAFCNSMLWTGSAAPIFAMGAQLLTISGSLELQHGMTITGTSGRITRFDSNRPEGETVKTNGVVINSNITFDGAGSWTLLDSLTMGSLSAAAGTLALANGTLDLNGNYVKCHTFRSSTSGERIIGTATTTTYDLPVNTYYNYSYTQQIFDASELNIPAGTRINSISFQYIHTVATTKNNLTVYLGNTGNSTFSNWIPVSAMQTVFTGSHTFNNTQPWSTITFSTPFVYTGDNLVVAVLNNHGSYNTGSNQTFRAHTASGNKAIHYRVDGSTAINPSAPPGGSLTTTRNNIRFIVETVAINVELNIANATIDVTDWYCPGIDAIETANSLIRVGNNFTGRPSDVYCTVEAGAGTLLGGTFSKIVMNKNKGSITSNTTGSSVTTDSLVLEKGEIYYITSGSTVTINEYFGNTGSLADCADRVELRSSAAALATVAMNTSAEMDLKNINLYYINATGNIPYTLPNSINLGGSPATAWTFTSSAPGGRYYWVGGPGNWDDLSHWSTTSGGAPSTCIMPSSNNTVVFDDNSGLGNADRVVLNVAGVCDSMLWLGSGSTSPIFVMGAQPLTISGSLELQPGMTITSSGGNITFNSSRAGEFIISNNVNIPRAIVLNNANGTWILQDALRLITGTTRFDLTFTHGALNLNGKNLTCGIFTTSGNNPRQLNITNSTIDVTSWDYVNANSLALTRTTETANSLIRVATNFTGRPTDEYNVVEAGTGTLQGGDFSKIIMSRNNALLTSNTALTTITTDSLILIMGNTYRITNGGSVNIRKYFGNTRNLVNCTEKIVLNSTSATANATIVMTPGAIVDLININFTRITINGEMLYPVEKAVDLGGSIGWDIRPITRLYWVGGPGAWSDINRWSTTSGGESDACFIPTSSHTVIFDENSGLNSRETVTLNTTGVCDSMLWIGNGVPIFNMGGNSLTVSGSLVLQPGMSFTGSGTTTFNSARSAGETVKTNNVRIPCNFTFNNASGNWTLEDALTLTNPGTITLTNGTLDLNGKDVSCLAFGHTNGNVTFNGTKLRVTNAYTFSNGNLDMTNSELLCNNFTSTAANARQLNISNAVIDVNNAWNYSGNTIAPVTTGSLLRIGTNFTGNTNTTYNVVEAGNGTILDGNFSKLIINKGNTTFNNAATGVINTDTLLFLPGAAQTVIFAGSSVNVADYMKKGFSDWLTVRSSSTTAQAIINMNMASNGQSAVIMDTLFLTQIRITGPGVDYPTRGSINGGGNIGWRFDQVANEFNDRAYYWLGGLRDGVFNNVDNWEVGFPGSGVYPALIFGPEDDVYFPPDPKNPATMPLTTRSASLIEFNSINVLTPGITITINAAAIPFRGTENITVSGAATFTITTLANFQIGGDVIVTNSSALTLPATTARNIWLNNFSNLTINGTTTISDTISVGAGSTFRGTNSAGCDDLIVNGAFTLTAGTHSVRNNMIVNGTSTLSSVSGLTVGNDMTINGTSTFSINSSSSVIVGNNMIINGTSTMSGSLSTSNVNVTNDVIINNNGLLSITNSNVSIGRDLQVSGTYNHTGSSSYSHTIAVNRNVDVMYEGLWNIQRSWSTTNYTITVNITGNTLIHSGGRIDAIVTGSPSSIRILYNSTGNYTVEGNSNFEWVQGTFRSSLTATGGARFINSTTILQSANPYLFDLGLDRMDTYFTGGALQFNAAAPYSLPHNRMIIPTTDITVTTANGNFISNGNPIKSKMFSLVGSATAGTRIVDISGSLIEAQDFRITGTRANEYVVNNNTVVSLWGTVNQRIQANLLASVMLPKITYSEIPTLLTVVMTTNGLSVDTLITGAKGMYLAYNGSALNALRANNWYINNFCDIYSVSESPYINVGRLTGPPPVFTCEGISRMHSTNGNIYFNRIAPGTPPQELRNLYFQRVVFSGPTFPAFTSPENYNIGLNSGSIQWTSPPDPEQSRDFYWIGDNGSWFDKTKWSFTSGGEPANCIPTFLDHAIFDQNSFSGINQEVVIDTIPAGIRHITWSDPEKRGQFIVNNHLEIYGSIDFTGCRYAYNPQNVKVIFRATGNETITSGGFIYNFERIEFHHSGTYTLQDNFILSQPMVCGSNTHGFYHYSGSLVSGGHNITTSFFNSTSLYGARSIDFSNSTIRILTNNTGTPVHRAQHCGTSLNTLSEVTNGNDWQLNLNNLTNCNLDGSKIIAFNVTTTGTAGQSVDYYDVDLYYAINQMAGLIVSYNDIYALARGGNSALSQAYFSFGFTARNIVLEAYRTYTFDQTDILPNEYIFTGTFTTTAQPMTGCRTSFPTRTVIQGSTITTPIPPPSRISVLNPPFELLRAAIYRIDCRGGQIMKVFDGLDNGQNIAVDIEFIPLEERPGRLDFYWVGGTGNWSDWNRWSIGESGVSPTLTNPCNYIPSQNDNVIFDVNSFTANNQDVILDLTTVDCFNMIWTPEAGARNPRIFTPNNSTTRNIDIYGSLELVQGIRAIQHAWSSNSSIIFNMRGASQVEGVQTIRFNGITANPMPAQINFTGGGRYDVLDTCGVVIAWNIVNVNNGSSLYLRRGLRMSNLDIAGTSSLYAGGKNITCTGYFNVASGTQLRTIDVSNSTVTANSLSWSLGASNTANISNATLNLATGSSFTFNGDLITWNAVNSTITVNGNLGLANTGSRRYEFNNIIMLGTTVLNTGTLGSGTNTGPFKFHTVEFLNMHTLITNANSRYTFDTLKYTFGSTNRIAANKTLDINDALIAYGTPCGFIYIYSTDETEGGNWAYINSVYCNPINIYFGGVKNVDPILTGGCSPNDYFLLGLEREQQIRKQNWNFMDFGARLAELLGRDTVVDCRTTLPFIQTTEGFGIARDYTWYYRPTRTTPWITLPDKTPTLEIWYEGQYALRAYYGDDCFLGDTLKVRRFITFDQYLPEPEITTYPETTHLTCTNHTITLTANIAEDPLEQLNSYEWKNSAGVSVGYRQSYLATVPDTYWVIVTRNRNYCVDSTSITLTVDQTYPIAEIIHLMPGAPNMLTCDLTEIEVEVINKNPEQAGSESYFWTAGLGNASTATITAPGIYFATITYPNGCASTDHIIIRPESKVAIASIFVDRHPTCAVGNDGAIRIYVHGGSGNGYEYDINNSGNFMDYDALTNGVITGLTAGSYRIQIRDKNTNLQCYIAESNEIVLRNTDSDLSVQIASTSASSCDASDGMILLVASGGTPPYRYAMRQGDGTPINKPIIGGMIEGLHPGIYIIDVTDSGTPNCTATSGEVRVTYDGSDFMLIMDTIIPTECGACDGSAIVTITGSNSFSYQHNSTPAVGPFIGSYSTQLFDLCAGVHTLRIFGDCGEIEESFIITNGENGLSVTARKGNITQYCILNIPGYITLNVKNGTAPYSYSMDHGLTWSEFDNPTASYDSIVIIYEGVYQIMVKDALDCTYEINTIRINRDVVPPVIAGTIYIVEEPHCEDGLTGSIQFYATGGSGQYEYDVYRNMNPIPFMSGIPYTTGLITGLPPGSYRIEVKDHDPYCNTARTPEIILRDSLYALNVVVAITPSDDCNSVIGNGVLDITVYGAPGPYNYTLNGVPQPGLTGDQVQITNLPVGIYVVEVDNGAGCLATSGEQHVTSEEFNLEVEVNPIFNTYCGVESGAVRFIVGGSGPYNYQLNSMPIPIASRFAPDTVILFNLQAGEHVLRIYTDCGDLAERFTVTNAIDSFSFTTVVTNENIACGHVTHGKILLTAVKGSAPYEYRIDFGEWIPFSGNTVEVSNLPQGYYHIEMQDNSGCTYSKNLIEIIREEAVPITIGSIFSATDPTCTTPGTVQVYATGGSGTYIYSVNGATSQAYPGGLITGLTAGSYRIEVLDAAGPECYPAMSGEIMLRNSISNLSVDVQVTDAPNCGSSGTLYITVQGGTTGFTCTLRTPGSTATTSIPLTGGQATITRPVGVYIIDVTDASGCIASSGEVRINSETPSFTVAGPTVNMNADCGAPIGIATFAVTGSTSYYYQLNSTQIEGPYNDNTPIQLRDLRAGSHILRIFDNCGEAVEPFVVPNNSNNFLATAKVVPELVSCERRVIFGEIILTAQNGTAPYQYRIDGGVWRNFTDSTVVIGNLTEGIYYIEVKDAGGCTFDINGVRLIREDAPPLVIGTVFAATQPSCYNPTGSIQIYVTGATGAYEYSYSRNGGPFQKASSSLITGLSAGSYRIAVTDTNGRSCANALSSEIMLYNLGSDLTLSVDVVNSLTCSQTFGNGMLLLHPSGGSTPGNYIYRLNGQLVEVINDTISRLPVGVYVVEIMDGSDCKVSSEEVRITSGASPLAITDPIVIQEPFCGFSTGQVSFIVNGNTPYYYQLNSMDVVEMNTTGTIVLTGLPAGVHKLRVFDHCKEIEKFFPILNANSGLTFEVAVTSVGVSCERNLVPGAITLTVYGGEAPYQYRIDGGAWIDFTAGIIAQIDSLNEGVYHIEVKDAEECIFEMNSVRIIREEMRPLAIGTVYTAVEPTCSTTGSIQIYASGGSGVYEYSVNGAGFVSYSGGLIDGLNAGFYHIVVRDTNNRTCPTAEVEFILENGNNDLTILVSPVPAEDCISNTGALSVIATGGIPPYEYSFDNGITWTLLPANGVISALPVGEYTVTVRDTINRACTTSAGAHITSEESTLDIEDFMVVSHPICESPIGAISFRVTGMNNSTYTYQLNNMNKVTVSGSHLVTITGIPAGEHILHISDICGSITVPITLANSNSALSFVPTVEHALAHCDNITVIPGQIILTVHEGQPPYAYRYNSGAWIPFADHNTNKDTIPNLNQGVYLLEVMDANGCTYAINKVDLIKEVIPSISIGTVYTTTEPNCDDNGSIQIYATGGSGVYEYSINGADYVRYPGGLITGLTAGHYHIMVRDTNYRTCDPAEIEFELENRKGALSITAVPAKAEDCISNTGAISVLVTGGTTPYFYRLNDEVTWVALPTNNVISDLSTGEYFIEVRDSESSFCTTNTKVHITSEESTLNIEEFRIISYSACEANIGMIAFKVTGMNNATYTYQVNNMNKVEMTVDDVEIIIEGLAAGEHILYISDTCGTIVKPFTISNLNSNLSFTPEVEHVKVQCDGITVTPASIIMTVHGGVAPYSYRYNSGAWLPFADYNTNRDTITGLNQGDYLVEVMDANGCTYAINRVKIIREESASISIGTVYAANNPDCDYNGSIQVFATGGSGVYEFSVNGAPYHLYTDGLITGLPAGHYHISVLDTNDRYCLPAEVEFELKNIGSALSLAVFPIQANTCTSADGKLSILVTGGVFPYYYSFNGGTTWTLLPANGLIENLATGEYIVDVRDSYTTPCTAGMKVHITSNESTLDIIDFAVIFQATCQLPIGAITFKVTGMNNSVYSYQLNNMNKVEMSVGDVAITLTGLSAGEHTLYVSDSCGSISHTFEIPNANSNLLFVPTVSHVYEDCFGTPVLGQIILNVTGGVKPYSYRFNSGDWIAFETYNTDTDTIRGLNEGIYLIEVKDANECVYAINRIELRKDVAMPVSIGTVHVVDEPSCGNSLGSLYFYVSGGSGNYLYTVSGDHTVYDYSQTNGLISGLPSGTYKIEVWDEMHPDCGSAISGDVVLYNSNSNMLVSVMPFDAVGTCNTANGSLLVSVSGGSGNYTYRVNGVLRPAVNGRITGLLPGLYIVEVTDNITQCMASSQQVRISAENAPALNLTVENAINTFCGLNIGVIRFIVEGEVPYYYQLNSTLVIEVTQPKDTITFAGLNAGVHILRLFDHCSEVSDTITISNGTSGLSFTATPENAKVYCDTVIPGKISIAVNNGSPSYSYRIDSSGWKAFSGTDTVVEVPDGAYLVEVKDNAGCSYEVNHVKVGREISQPLALGTVQVLTNPSCSLASSGSIQFYVNGGSGDYLYTVSGDVTVYDYGVTGGLIGNLNAGTYKITVWDKNHADCPAVTSNAVVLHTSDVTMVVIVDPVDADNCTDNTGELLVMVLGGSGSYTYTFADGSAANVANGAISGLNAGLYIINVKDNNTNCLASSEEVRINAKTGFNLNLSVKDTVHTSCGSTTGAIIFTVSGTPSYYYQLNSTPVVEVTRANDTVVLMGLNAGEHILRLFNNCGEITDTIRITNGTDGLSFTAVAQDVIVRCDTTIPGKIAIEVNGGNEPYSYRINGSQPWTEFSGNTIVIDVREGLYLVEVKDRDSCMYAVNGVGVLREDECIPRTVTLDLKLFLQGPTRIGAYTFKGVPQFGTHMPNRIQVPQYPWYTELKLPIDNPYGVSGSYPEINSVTGPAYEVVDWVLVEIWTNLNPLTYTYDFLESRALLLRVDGSVVDVNGELPEFNASSSNVHIVVKHRNHMAVMSSANLVFRTDTVEYDFSTGINKAYSLPLPTLPDQMIMKNGVATLIAGDLNMDYVINATDVNIFNNTFYFVSGLWRYVVTDINLDGVIDAADSSLIMDNFYLRSSYSVLRFCTRNN
ncbi:MAG: hypothetical protein FWC34_05385 [Bacteroidetes bacterium]|nr:hypothetical protein [Bacteroidota bacterium]MCL2303120.1 hypothetical protein [Lentimicrobiaceae bacterium]